MQARKDGLGATKVKVASNIIQGGNSAAAISGPYTDAVWEKNTIFNTVAGDMPDGTYSVKDPNLAKDQSGVFRLTVNSSLVLDGQKKIEYVKTKALYPGEVGASAGK